MSGRIFEKHMQLDVDHYMLSKKHLRNIIRIEFNRVVIQNIMDIVDL